MVLSKIVVDSLALGAARTARPPCVMASRNPRSPRSIASCAAAASSPQNRASDPRPPMCVARTYCRASDGGQRWSTGSAAMAPGSKCSPSSTTTCDGRVLANEVFTTVRAPDVRRFDSACCGTYGSPDIVLTDNGAIYNARSRQSRTGFEIDLDRRGVLYGNSTPHHPQTCGKVERWHRTLKNLRLKRPVDTHRTQWGQAQRVAPTGFEPVPPP